MKKDYMTRLERAARWRLPPQEAEDVIADYRDIVSNPPRTEEQLRREVGDPEQVIKLLVSPPRAYRVWQAVFAVMAACILTLGISPTAIGYPFWRIYFDGYTEHPLGIPVTVLGAVTALVWFRWQGRKEERLPRAIPILLAVFLACIGGVLWFCWACARDFDGFLQMWGTMRPLIAIGPNSSVPRSTYLCRLVMEYGSAIISLIGAFALLKARMGDRRWSAVYVLGLTAMLAALFVLDLTGRMDPTGISIEAALRQMLAQCSVIAAIGLIGTGVALC